MRHKSQPNGICLITLALTFILIGCGKGKTPASGKAGSAEDPASIVSNKLAGIAAAGDPVTLDELNKSYVSPPAAENAAVIYEQAFSALTAEDSKSPTLLAHNQNALALLLQAAERKSCRYPVELTDGAFARLPHLAKIKKCASLLQNEIVSQAERGRTDASAKAFLAGVSLARSLDKEPLIISRLVAISCLTLTFQGLELALSRKAFTDDQLLSMQTALQDAESAASFRRALVGERVAVISYFQMTPEELAKLQSKAGETGQQESDWAAYRKTATFQQDFDFALDYLAALVALSEMPFPQCLGAGAQATVPKMETAISKGYLMSKLFLPALSNLGSRSAEGTARIRVTRAALGIERYRLKHANALPGSLAELTPELLDTVPQDPFDGQALRYKKLPGKGYVVYSLGKNQKDDDGVEKSPDGKTQLDLSISVHR